MKTFKGIVDGEVKGISFNDAETHYYIDGRRVSKDFALEANKVFVERQNGRIKVTASKNNSGKPSYILNEDEAKSVCEYFKFAKEIVKINERKERFFALVNGNDSVKEFFRNVQKIKSSGKSIGFSGKIVSKLDLGDKVDNATVNTEVLSNVVLRFVENGNRFSLKKSEVEQLSTLFKGWGGDLVSCLLDVLSGKLKIGIDRKRVEEVIK